MTVIAPVEVRRASVLDLVRNDGDVEVRHSRPESPTPVVDIRIRAPGGRAGHLVSFRYFEVYRPGSGGLVIAEYAFGLYSQHGLGSLEFHWHPLPGSGGHNIHHVHCTPGGPGRRRDHYRGHQMYLEEARARFLAIYASEAPVSCVGLYPLGRPVG
jgi:hypothetical protein